uniref:Uncharacterized protein n=2 Tax=Rhodosorus marinus TaxID=101924 RepID=A0A7S2ZMS3_9RHOD|mmetsp:Transcript_22652/g.90773  ORF Transcript_22652/g.90773 Transcript_22652/m.90773 type:complete len:237 (+) Transcript_22652:30-740(+)
MGFVGPALFRLGPEIERRLICRCSARADDEAARTNAGRLAIGASVVSFASTLTNRLFASGEVVDAHSRADLMCVASGAMLLLYGIANVQIDPREEETVDLKGEEVSEIQKSDPDGLLGWASRSIIASIPNVRSVLIYEGGKTVLREGIMGESPVVVPGPILEKALTSEEKTYFARLEILPGRFEFTYLPKETQAVLIQPLSPTSALILGADKVRPIASVDFGWIQAITQRVSQYVG